MARAYTVTSETGGTAALTPASTVPPAGLTTEEAQLTFGAGTGLNPVILADQLSAFLAHERCGVHLYRAVRGLTTIDEWREQYERFGEQTEEHVGILEELVSALGGDAMYVSTAARLVEAQDSKLLETMLVAGTLEARTVELACLEAVLQAERKCHGNWQLLSKLSKQLDRSEAADAISKAVSEVEEQEDEHVEWAERTWETAVTSRLLATT